MRFVTRMVLLLIVTLALAGAAVAQETATDVASSTAASTDAEASTTTAEGTADEAASAKPERLLNSYQLQNQFGTLLRQHPEELATILLLDPTLLSNEAFLAGYPELSSFVARHPEVRRNPQFYLGEFRRRESNLGEILEPITIMGTMSIIAFAFAWLIRTIIEQKRWSRLSRTQTEVHNKILDRFATSGELLEYVKTSAGAKFLESAPIPLHADQPPQNAPFSRVLWSIQIGVVVAAGAIGMLGVSYRFENESGDGLFAMGMIGLCVGIGFVASAIVSLYLSRRIGLGPDSTLPSEPGLVK